MKKKSILIVLAILFVFIAVIPVRNTFAYFTAHAEASGQAKVDLTWKTDLTEEIDENNKDKHITITNVGDTPVIVRVNVFAGDVATTTPEKGHEEDWKLIDGWWYYTKILGVGDTTPELFVEVVVENAPDYDFNIVVVHESSRVVYQNGSTTKLELPTGWKAPTEVAA
ncbi:MAG: hypothetical protein IKG47_07050 [Oscillospiraceae bacterium]|nr:hypothetical protein [Oscillospiraceae bacterium]